MVKAATSPPRNEGEAIRSLAIGPQKVHEFPCGGKASAGQTAKNCVVQSRMSGRTNWTQRAGEPVQAIRGHGRATRASVRFTEGDPDRRPNAILWSSSLSPHEVLGRASNQSPECGVEPL